MDHPRYAPNPNESSVTQHVYIPSDGSIGARGPADTLPDCCSSVLGEGRRGERDKDAVLDCGGRIGDGLGGEAGVGGFRVARGSESGVVCCDVAGGCCVRDVGWGSWGTVAWVGGGDFHARLKKGDLAGKEDDGG